jgi:hypothetical protein
MGDYERAESQLRSRMTINPGYVDLIRLATLAPSGHNTQPWRFTPSEAAIRIRPDLSRRTRIVDPDDHHLFVSLGCAAENLLVAAAANGRPGSIEFSEGPEDQIDIDLAYGSAVSDALYPAILMNQSTRSNYDGRSVSIADLKLLESTARIPGVSVLFVTERTKREEILEYVLQSNDDQMSNPAFVEELRDWIRFNPVQALGAGDGLFTLCSGQPIVPTWIGRRAFTHFFT